MLKFSNMTLQEFLRLNANEIPAEIVDFLEEMQQEIDALKEERDELSEKCERMEEILEAIKDSVYKY